MHRENHTDLCVPCTTSAHGYSTTTQVNRKKKKMNANKFFLCFRSVDVVGSGKPGRRRRNVFTYVAVGEKEGVVFPKVVPVASSLTTTDDEGDDDKCRPTTPQRKKGGCGFCQVLKAVVFETTLVKKIQNRKLGKKFVSTKNESPITSSYTQAWVKEDVPEMISKTTTSYVAVEEKEGVVLPKVSLMASPLLGKEENEEKDDGRYWSSKGRRRLSHVFKAVLFETSLAKKIKSRKKGKKFERNASSKYNQQLSEEDDPRMMSADTSSSLTNCSVFTTSSMNSSSSSLSHISNTTTSSIRSLSKRIKSFRSSSSSSIKANLRHLSEKIRSNSSSLKSKSSSFSDKNKLFESTSICSKEGNGHDQDQDQDQDVMDIEKMNDRKGCYKAIVCLCFLLMSLLGLIFYGKICAILCTSVWLFSVPLWSSVGETNKVEKKKIIMGGLLARDTGTIHRR